MCSEVLSCTVMSEYIGYYRFSVNSDQSGHFPLMSYINNAFQPADSVLKECFF